MAIFNTKSFIVYDDYMSPKSAWEAINHLIPKNKVIWEAFYGDWKSGQYLTELGYDVIVPEEGKHEWIVVNPKELIVLGSKKDIKQFLNS